MAHNKIYSLTSEYWDQIANQLVGHFYFNSQLSHYKAECILKLFYGIVHETRGCRVLKTDLWEEAFGESKIFCQKEFGNSFNFGLDISYQVSHNALENKDLAHHCLVINSDIQHSPFRDNLFDIIISTSTLDHFQCKIAFLAGMEELYRILKPGGKLFLILDNPYFVFRWLTILKYKLGVIPIYIGKTYSWRKSRRIAQPIGFAWKNHHYAMHIPVITFTGLFRQLDPLFGKKGGKLLKILESWLERFPTSIFTATYISMYLTKPEDPQIPDVRGS